MCSTACRMPCIRAAPISAWCCRAIARCCASSIRYAFSAGSTCAVPMASSVCAFWKRAIPILLFRYGWSTVRRCSTARAILMSMPAARTGRTTPSASRCLRGWRRTWRRMRWISAGSLGWCTRTTGRPGWWRRFWPSSRCARKPCSPFTTWPMAVIFRTAISCACNCPATGGRPRGWSSTAVFRC